MIYPFSINVKKFRSIRDESLIPLNTKTTLIVGQNNAGKSNILRSLAAIFNKRFDIGDPDYEFEILLNDNDYLKEALGSSCMRAIGSHPIKIVIKEGVPSTPTDVPPDLYEYANSGQFLNEFNNSSSINNNVTQIYNKISSLIQRELKGTVYVPTTRFITAKNKEPERFSRFDMPGETINYGTIVARLAEMDRPPTDKRDLRIKFRELEDFLSHCLEKPGVRIEIPNDTSTIHVKIDDDERPIEDLGTGVEQLVILGLASFGFPGKLVLIDEPELHFHPRAQKRMVRYLNETVDARFVFATHSAAILDAIEADVLQVTYDRGHSIVRTLRNNNDRYRAVRDLGHSPSDLLQTRFAIWVEGPSDRVYINHWISKLAPELVEGVDFTILFYGGKILSHHSFIDEDSELVKAVTLSRAFAVIMDSDRKPGRPAINSTKQRVKDEIEAQGGICWITQGREVENYLPESVVRVLASSFPGCSVPKTKLDQVLDPEKVRKNDFARAATAVKTDEWPLDLKQRILDLTSAISSAH